MLRLEKVDGRNLWDILKLRVCQGQEEFVASNEASLAKAYVAVTSGGRVSPFGIYHGDEPVGFLLIAYSTYAHWDDAPKIAYGNYSIWRLMIDRNHQHKGYGKKALALALDFIWGKPYGEAEYCWLSYARDNVTAKRMYGDFGFVETGEAYGGEIIAALKL